MSLKSATEELKQNLRSLRKSILGRGGEISLTAGLKDCPEAVFNIPADASLAFYEDSEVAYQKNVPENALTYAAIGKVGGMTRKCANLIKGISEASKIANGITFTVNEDNSITVNGTATANANFVVSSFYLKPNTTYCISSSVKNSSDKTYQMWAKSGNNTFSEMYTIGNGTTFITTDRDYISIYIYVYSGTTVNNLVFKPMLNEGSTALPYEPYFEGLRSAPVTEVQSAGSNNLMFPYQFTQQSSNGITVVVNADGSITANGTATANAFFDLFSTLANIGLVEGERYFMSDGVKRTDAYVRMLGTDGKGYYNSAFYYHRGMYPQIRVQSGTVLDNVTFKPMISKGPTAIPYRPYIGAIERKLTPEAVQSIDGYGWGVNDTCYNYIDWEKMQFVKRVGCADLGKLYWVYWENNTFYTDAVDKSNGVLNLLTANYTTAVGFIDGNINGNEFNRNVYITDNKYSTVKDFKSAMSGVMLYYELAEPVITDISDILPEDNFIKVEGGGTITMVNEYQYAVPSTIKYTRKVAV